MSGICNLNVFERTGMGQHKREWDYDALQVLFDWKHVYRFSEFVAVLKLA